MFRCCTVRIVFSDKPKNGPNRLHDHIIFHYNFQITMDFSYLYRDDPDHDELRGNITWIIPNFDTPAHWIHAEMICTQMSCKNNSISLKLWLLGYHRSFSWFRFTDEGIYNTYILDTDYKSWALIMHCAEKAKSTRYLSALLLSRERKIGINVVNYLRWTLESFKHVHVSFYRLLFAGKNCRSTTSIYHSCSRLHKMIVKIGNNRNAPCNSPEI